jgi:competence protein ComEA
MKRIIKDYFTFSKKERTAIILLLLLITCFLAAPYVYSVKLKPPVLNKALRNFLEKNTGFSPGDSLQENNISVKSTEESYHSAKAEVFLFDPNTISAEEWKRLGISNKTIRTIYNYLSKGGKFRSAEDIKKIWGFKEEDAERLIPFVRMQQRDQPNKSFKNNPLNPQPVTSNKIPSIDINTATAEEWKALPGIGEVLANRIIKFRERIGGFTTIEQVHKTYGISDSVFGQISSYLVFNPAALPKLNLNTISAYELRMRVAIPDAIARAIVMYRNQYGPYQSVNDLKKIVFISDSLFQRISLVLKVE